MKKLALVAMFLLGFSLVSAAQDDPAAEVYLGYAYTRCDAQEMNGESDDMGCDMSGWNGSVSLNPNKNVGIVFDFGGTYGTVDDSVDINLSSVMLGPKFTYRTERATPFVQVLVGWAHPNVKMGPEVLKKENDFGMAFGGGVDVNITDIVAVRPVQLDYFVIKSGNSMLDNFRYSGGIVFKIGNR